MVLKLIPVKLVQKYRCLPLFVKHDGAVGVLFVGMEYPNDLSAVYDLSFHAGMDLLQMLVAPSELRPPVDAVSAGGSGQPRHHLVRPGIDDRDVIGGLHVRAGQRPRHCGQ